jgi:microcystin-dependent protein
MSEPFIAEIRIFTFNFAPRDWAQCNGQLVPIQQNTALFSLLGVTYGGNGTTNFALPNLQCQVPLHWGQSTTGTVYDLGQQSGAFSVTLLSTEMPSHTHTMAAMFSGGHPSLSSPTDAYLADGACKPFGSAQLASNTALSPLSVSAAGSSLPHSNMMPSLVINFCIALAGVFPVRP